MAGKETGTGSIAANFHEGSRSEYLQTMARFGAAVAPELPARMALVPGEPGPEVPWKPGEPGPDRTFGFGGATGSYLLGPPILEFKVEELLDDERFEQFRKVLHFWILNNFDNVRRYQMGMRVSFRTRLHGFPHSPARRGGRRLRRTWRNVYRASLADQRATRGM